MVSPGQPLKPLQLRELGELVEARHVLCGTYERPAATNWYLTFRLVDVASGRVSRNIVLHGSNLVQLIPDAVTAVLSEIRCSPSAAEEKRIRRPLTRSAEALEILSQLQHRSDSSLNQDEVDLRRAVALDPGCAIAIQGLAFVLDQEDKVDEALEVASRAVEADPECGLAHKTLGMICFEKGLKERAERELIHAATLLTDSPKSQLALADLYVDETRLTEATAVLRQAERIAPYEPMVHIKLGAVYSRLAEKNQAVTELRLAERCQGKPNPWFDLQLARTYADLHEVPEAIKFLERHIEELSALPELSPDLAKDKKQSEEILSSLKATLTPHFVSVPTPSNRGQSASNETAVAHAAHRPKSDPFSSTVEMQIWAREAVGAELDPLRKAKRIFEALTSRACSSSEPGARTAAQAFEALSKPRATFCCEEFTFLYVALVRSVGVDAYFVLVDKDAFNKSVAHACTGIVFTNSQALLVDLGYAWFGAPHREWKFLTDEQATAIFLSETGKTSKQKLAVNMFPESARVHFNFAYSLARDGKLPEAKQELEEGLRIDHSSWRAKYAQAMVEATEGELTKAELDAKDALSLYHELSAAHYLLGWVFEERGRLEEARDEFQVALQTATSTEGRIAARDRIANLTERLAKIANSSPVPAGHP